MKRTYEFYNAKPLLSFLDYHRKTIIGQHIKHFFSNAPFGSMSDMPIAFELDDFSIIISYFFYSDMTIHIVDTQMLKNDLSLNFLYNDISESCNLEQWVSEREFPYAGQEIVDIRIKQFSHGFETNPATRETRPDGGDYFSVITVVLLNGQTLHVCAADPTCDGYVEVR